MPGDIISLAAGDMVPADALLLTATCTYLLLVEAVKRRLIGRLTS